jgi:hypothetical protein
MSVEFDFLTPSDKPALLGLSSVELQDTAKTALDQLGYKVHLASNHGEFIHKFQQIPYQVCLIEELFACNSPEENESLAFIQRLSTAQRRHCTFVMFGFSLSTFNPLQAVQQGVHAVVNPSEMFLLIQLIQKAVADNDMFLNNFREAQKSLG